MKQPQQIFLPEGLILKPKHKIKKIVFTINIFVMGDKIANEIIEDATSPDLYKTDSLKRNLSEETLGVLESVIIKTYGGVGSEISSLTGSATLIEIQRQ